MFFLVFTDFLQNWIRIDCCPCIFDFWMFVERDQGQSTSIYDLITNRILSLIIKTNTREINKLLSSPNISKTILFDITQISFKFIMRSKTKHITKSLIRLSHNFIMSAPLILMIQISLPSCSLNYTRMIVLMNQNRIIRSVKVITVCPESDTIGKFLSIKSIRCTTIEHDGSKCVRFTERNASRPKGDQKIFSWGCVLAGLMTGDTKIFHKLGIT
mmetsp:Transcript_26389/g.36777  ORF Transcript_26389/g.36777 Transcript_26389/m.36777 type:complete len:215 (+) Transcript_26389:41-685(+)